MRQHSYRWVGLCAMQVFKVNYFLAVVESRRMDVEWSAFIDWKGLSVDHCHNKLAEQDTSICGIRTRLPQVNDRKYFRQ